MQEGLLIEMEEEIYSISISEQWDSSVIFCSSVVF